MKDFYYKKILFTLCLLLATGTLFSVKGSIMANEGTYLEASDKAEPEFATRESFIIFLDENGEASLNPAEYNLGTIVADCEIVSLTYDRTDFDCGDVGFHVIQVTATDCNGLSATGEADVEVRNEIIPKFLGRESFIIFLDENGKATLSPDQINRDNISANCGIDRIELSQTEFDCEDVGFHEVTVTAFDRGTFSFSTTADVEVRNEIIPKFLGRESFIIFLDENGKATLSPDQINRDNISANCGIDRIELSQTEFDCEDVGFHEVTVTAFDRGTFSFSTTADVEVRNEIIPKFLGRESFIIFLDENGKATLSPDQINRDNISANCGIDRIELSQTEFDCEDVGFHEVTVTAFDRGTFSFSTTADVEVRNEIQPSFLTRESFVLTLDENGRATLSPDQYNRETISANCGISRIEFDRTEFDCGDLGDNVIKVTAFDFGTFSFETEADVRVIDNLVPNIILNGDATVNLNIGDTYTELGASVEDNCETTPLLIGNTVDTSVPGTFTVTYNASDASGNAAEEITRTINIIDNVPPVIIANDITVFTRDDRCSAVVENYDLTITDASGIERQFLNFQEGTVFPTGVTEVTIFARDNAGNVATDSFTVTVIDNVTPTVEAAGMQVFLDENGQGSLGNISAPELIFFEDFEADTIGRDLEALTNWNVVDGNVDVFTGENRALPTTNIALVLAGNTNGTIESKESVTLTPGNYRLRVDYWGLSGEEASFSVQIGDVLDDSITDFVNEFFEPAEFDFVVIETITVPIRITEFGGGDPGRGTIIDNVRLLRQPDFNVFDNCEVTNITVSQSEFTAADLGINPVTITVADVAGNTASTDIEVEVIDSIAPTVVTKNIRVALGPDGTVTIDPSQIDNGSSDNTGGALTFSLSKTTFTCADLSINKKRFKKRKKGLRRNEVTLTVTDPSGNQSSATATVRVIDDLKPTFSKEPITLYVFGRGTFRLTRSDIASRVSDNCAVKSFSIPGKRFRTRNVGLNRVRVKATDRSGNIRVGTVLVNVVDISHLGKRVELCFRGGTLRVRPQFVNGLIRRGASFGSCSNFALAPQVPAETNLEQEELVIEPMVELSAYPNPTNAIANITFSSNKEGRAMLTIFNSAKPNPIVLFDQDIEANTNQKVTFDTSDLPVGVYILRLNTAEGVKVMKLIVRR